LKLIVFYMFAKVFSWFALLKYRINLLWKNDESIFSIVNPC